jgi:hypothetical protein
MQLRALVPALPVSGLVVGVLALVLWVSAVALGWLDILVALLFLGGLGASIAGYFMGTTDRARRLGVVGIGWNAFGLAAVLILYAAG